MRSIRLRPLLAPLWVVFLGCMAPTLTLAQVTRFVSTTGTNTNPASATSWATSTTNLQGAINASASGDQVWVAAGTYKPTTTTGPASRTISFSMANSVTIVGGFRGNETTLSQRPAINPVNGNPSSSTLSGEISDPNSTTDNSYHVISNPGSLSLNNSAVLDGFVITGGNANGGTNSFPDNAGGGMYNNGSGSGQVCSPLIRNCLFGFNTVSFRGGAMYNDGSDGGNSSPSLTNCAFQTNTADFGGAMYNDGVAGNSSPVLTNCAFQTNTARIGGAMSNVGEAGGTSSPSLTNCSFQANTANEWGGAMYNAGYFSGTCLPVLTNCAFQTNTAKSGGAMYNDGLSGNSSPRLINCSFQANTATFLQRGGAMYNDGRQGTSNISLTNCVLFGNGETATFYNRDAMVTARYSLFDASVIDYTGSNNLTTFISPFLSTTAIELNPASCAINAGDPNSQTVATSPYSVTALPQTDLVGNPRIFGPGLPAARVDMGAVEYQAAPQYPTRLYVREGASGANTGLTWTDAFTDLQRALTYPCSQSLTEIWVARGTYKPTSTTARNVSFAMLPNVAVIGGFVGSETALSGRPAINPVNGQPSSSMLSGEIGDPNSTTDNSYHVINNPASLSLNNTAVLDGFVITGGNANGRFVDASGGGVYNNQSSPTFRNCAFQLNTAQAGGAMLNDGLRGTSSPVLTNCALQLNTASGSGGAMYNDGYDGTSSPVLTNCALQQNTARFGGAIYNTGAGAGTSSPVLTNCALQLNTAQDGGAIYNYGASVGTSSPVLTNCALQQNTARFGGAIYNNGNRGTSNPILTNCAFLANSASSSGGALYNVGAKGTSSPLLTNCVLFGNGETNTFGNDDTTGPTATYSLFDNTSGVNISGPGNLTTTTSPFVSTSSVALNACSPAINAGNSASYAAANGPATDLAGNPRTAGPSIDMGAVEFQGPANLPVGITQQPQATASICPGGMVTAGVSVSGSVASYLWFRGNTPLPSQTSATLSLTNLQAADAGNYQVVITGACPPGAPASVTSTAVVVSVLPNPNALLVGAVNLSCTTPTLTLTAIGGSTYLFSGPAGGLVSQTNGRERIVVGDYVLFRTPIPTVGTAVVSKPGLYTVLVTNVSGCTSTAQIEVTGTECRQ